MSGPPRPIRFACAKANARDMNFLSLFHSQGQKFTYCTTCDFAKTFRAYAMFSSSAAKYLSQVNPVLSFSMSMSTAVSGRLMPRDPAVEFLRQRREQPLIALAHGGIPLLRHPAVAHGLVLARVVDLRHQSAAVHRILQQVLRHVSCPISKKRSWIWMNSFRSSAWRKCRSCSICAKSYWPLAVSSYFQL